MERTHAMPRFDAAVQYLTWALEEIEKLGHPKAARDARTALNELCGGARESMSRRYAEEAKRFRDKADEAEQLAELGSNSIKT